MSQAISAAEDGGHFIMIPLTQGKFAIVSEADAALVSWRKWCTRGVVGQHQRTLYAQTTVCADELVGVPLPGRRTPGPRVDVAMHWLLTGHVLVDHVNHNGLDNRRINLRVATAAQSVANRRLFRNNTSGYKGVYRVRNSRKWKAQISIDGHDKHLGVFDDPVEAARAYNRAAIGEWGEFAWLNPIPDAPESPAA